MGESEDGEVYGEGREWRLPCPLCEDDLVLCSESEEELKVMVERFVELCRIRGFEANRSMDVWRRGGTRV